MVNCCGNACLPRLYGLGRYFYNSLNIPWQISGLVGFWLDRSRSYCWITFLGWNFQSVLGTMFGGSNIFPPLYFVDRFTVFGLVIHVTRQCTSHSDGYNHRLCTTKSANPNCGSDLLVIHNHPPFWFVSRLCAYVVVPVLDAGYL